MVRFIKRCGAGAGAVLLMVGLWFGTASAHVTINTLGVVTQGSFAKVGFSVPNERDDAGTVKVKVQFPQDHPLAYVSVQPLPGWDVETTTRQLETPLEGEGSTITQVVDTVTWTATGDTQIKPGEFQLFWVSAGQMPTDVTSLSFPTIQTYSSGEEVSWIDKATEGGVEPEHPAPTLQLAASDSGASATPTTAAPAVADDGDSSDGDSNALSIVAIVIGALGLVAGGVALATSRKQRSAAA